MVNISKANPTKFQLIFPLLPELDDFTDQKKFSLNIIDGILPSLTLNVVDASYRAGFNHYEMGGVEFGQWNTQFIIDDEFKTWLILSDWIFSIYNSKTVLGRDDQNYMVDANLLISNNYNNSLVNIHFDNIFPIEIGEIKMSYQEGEALLIGNVTFIYDRFYKEQ